MELAVIKAAKEAEQREIFELSARDQERFVNALLGSPKPNEALKRAFEYHKKMVKNG